MKLKRAIGRQQTKAEEVKGSRAEIRMRLRKDLEKLQRRDQSTEDQNLPSYVSSTVD